MKIVIAAALLLTGSAAAAQDANFPEPRRAWLSEGLFVTPGTARLVQPGMTKPQVSALLGPPHFGEAFFSKRWNYVLNFYTNDGAGPGHVTCQLQLGYSDGKVTTAAWSSPECASLVAYKPPMMAQESVRTEVQVVKEPSDVVISEMTVLFRHDSSALSPAARQVIAEAVAMTRSQPVRKTVVVGGTDRSGSVVHNLVLSGKRAKAVANSLAAAGVVLADATVAQTGEDSPAVSTAAGVRNAANRRVVITMIR